MIGSDGDSDSNDRYASDDSDEDVIDDDDVSDGEDETDNDYEENATITARSRPNRAMRKAIRFLMTMSAMVRMKLTTTTRKMTTITARSRPNRAMRKADFLREVALYQNGTCFWFLH